MNNSINDHGYCAENLLDTMVRKSLNVDVVDDCGRYVCCGNLSVTIG